MRDKRFPMSLLFCADCLGPRPDESLYYYRERSEEDEVWECSCCGDDTQEKLAPFGPSGALVEYDPAVGYYVRHPFAHTPSNLTAFARFAKEEA